MVACNVPQNFDIQTDHMPVCGAGDREEECMQGMKEEDKTEKAQDREER